LLLLKDKDHAIKKDKQQLSFMGKKGEGYQKLSP
jgi:hypothetical protein